MEKIPTVLDEGRLYISMEYATAIHRCACGCGLEVVTPLGPTDWKLIFDGTVSLSPSIGNWNFPCRSHYWLKRDRVEWAGSWTDDQIKLNRDYDIRHKKVLYAESDSAPETAKDLKPKPSFWQRLVSWFVKD